MNTSLMQEKIGTFIVAHRLCDTAGMVFVEDLNLKAMSRVMLCKHTLDAAFKHLNNIVEQDHRFIKRIGQSRDGVWVQHARAFLERV